MESGGDSFPTSIFLLETCARRAILGPFANRCLNDSLRARTPEGNHRSRIESADANRQSADPNTITYSAYSNVLGWISGPFFSIFRAPFRGQPRSPVGFFPSRIASPRRYGPHDGIAIPFTDFCLRKLVKPRRHVPRFRVLLGPDHDQAGRTLWGFRFRG